MTYKDILTEKGFTYDLEKEIWVRKHGFNREDKVDVMFKKLFIMHKNNKLVHDNFIETFEKFQEVVNIHFN